MGWMIAILLIGILYAFTGFLHITSYKYLGTKQNLYYAIAWWIGALIWFYNAWMCNNSSLTLT